MFDVNCNNEKNFALEAYRETLNLAIPIVTVTAGVALLHQIIIEFGEATKVANETSTSMVQFTLKKITFGTKIDINP
jgi:hypothetical protein